MRTLTGRYLEPAHGRRHCRIVLGQGSLRWLHATPSGALGTRMGPEPLTWRGLIRFPADRIHKAIVESLVPGALAPVSDPDAGPSAAGCGEWACHWEFEARGNHDRLAGKIGFRAGLDADHRRLLEENHALLIKAHYALWARAFAETDGDPERTLRLSLSQLCDDLGYARLRNGSHRPGCKRQAMRVVELLAALELDVEYHAPNGRRVRVAGAAWRLLPGPEDERRFRLLPGEWAANPAWRVANRHVGLAGAGLLTLRPDHDRWAICAGGYLAALARMNGYRPLRIRVRTLLRKCGLLRAERRNPGRMRDKLERALERLEEAGVIGGWDWNAVASNEPDMDAAEDLASLAGAAADWQDRTLLIQWPSELRVREERLHAARQAHRRSPRGRRASQS